MIILLNKNLKSLKAFGEYSWPAQMKVQIALWTNSLSAAEIFTCQGKITGDRIRFSAIGL